MSFAVPEPQTSLIHDAPVKIYCRCLGKYENYSPNLCPEILVKWESGFRAKVVGHDVCAFVYFHSIVFCLDFHRGEQYLRKQGRKCDENKGRGREPSVMEPVAR